jgi:NTE family protein
VINSLLRVPLFQGLTRSQLEEVATRMGPRAFAAGETICRAGEPGHSLFLIQHGLALVRVPGAATPIARLRRGDVIGEMSLLTGEPRTADVEAAAPTEALELSRDTFAGILSTYPVVLANLGRILSERLARTNLRTVQRRGEAIALLVDDAGGQFLEPILAATRGASPTPVAHLDLRPPSELSLDGALRALDDALDSHRATLVVAPADGEGASALSQQVDRVVVLAGPGGVVRGGHDGAELVLVTEAPVPPAIAPVRILQPGAPTRRDVEWIGRHLARTKLGLSLGAGGAKGYAHIGAIRVLEEAGYTIDYVSGSSIGAFVGCWLAMGRSATEVEATMRRAFAPETVDALFALSLSGMSTGIDVVRKMCRETTEGLAFADLHIPLTVMCVDLNTRQPSPITGGPLWEALLAALALAGLFPPYELDGKRLVDGLALVPVPVSSVVAAGADIAVSCNIMSRDTLSAWPEEEPDHTPSTPAKGRVRLLDTLLEVMDLSQLDASIRTAALADVVITPRFGPSSWRDFHLADRFLRAGQQAAELAVGELQRLARPQAQP